MLKKYLADRRLKKFLKEMTVLLAKDYGRAPEYTEGQVKTALEKLGFGEEFFEVGIAIWCNEESAKKLGLSDALIKTYRGYPVVHNIVPGGSDSSGNDFVD